MTVKNVDPLHHRVWVAMRYSQAFLILMSAAACCVGVALLLALAGTWIVSLVLIAGAVVMAWFGWRKGAI